MTYSVSDKEFSVILGLSALLRYEHFVKRVADWETVWSLGKVEGWALLADSEKREVIPVWPHERYAAACASGDWAGNSPRLIPLAK